MRRRLLLRPGPEANTWAGGSLHLGMMVGAAGGVTGRCLLL